ncbi:MAG: hypothetical protein AB1896_05635 [Thermodesulfobacteriota bacterium]
MRTFFPNHGGRIKVEVRVMVTAAALAAVLLLLVPSLAPAQDDNPAGLQGLVRDWLGGVWSEVGPPELFPNLGVGLEPRIPDSGRNFSGWAEAFEEYSNEPPGPGGPFVLTFRDYI